VRPAESTRVLRRERKRAWKHTPTGRRATHAVQTTYGRHQRDRDWRESFAAAVAAFKAEREAVQS
jgi:hypothetical protein